MKTKLYETLNIRIKGVDEETSTIEAVFSTEDEDRHGDIVRQNWDLKSYKKNPVILNSHNYWSATDVIGRAEKIGIKNGQLEGKIKFAVEENPIAKIIYDLYKGGFLSAFSVGFIPKEFSDKGEILKSELLEISAVSVPANAYALAKSAGIDLKPLFKGITDVLEAKEIEDDEIDDEEDEEAPDDELEPEIEEEGDDHVLTEEDLVNNPELADAGLKVGDKVKLPLEKEPEETPEQQEQAKEDAEKDIKEDEIGRCPIEGECEAEKQLKDNLSKMTELIKASGEIIKAETLQEGVRADAKRLLNKAIRESLKIIKNN